jgi:hypothetical protein
VLVRGVVVICVVIDCCMEVRLLLLVAIDDC